MRLHILRSSLVVVCGLACSAALTVFDSSNASAQPSPFDAYEGKKQVEQEQQATVTTTTPTTTQPGAQTCDCVSEKTMFAPIQQGQLVFDVRTSLSATLSGNETAEGSTVRNTTFFSRFSPGVGYFLRDGLEVGGNVGVMWRRIARDEDDFSTTRDFLLEGRVRYHYALTQRFTLIPGASLGGYFGRSERALAATQNGMPTTVNETTRTSGGAATLSLDAGYLIKPRISINAGIGVIGLLGNERIGSLEERFRVTTLNSSLNLGLAYAF